MKRPLEPKPKVKCLFHDAQKRPCICIYPVTTEEKLAERLRNQQILFKRFGIKV